MLGSLFYELEQPLCVCVCVWGGGGWGGGGRVIIFYRKIIFLKKIGVVPQNTKTYFLGVGGGGWLYL